MFKQLYDRLKKKLYFVPIKMKNYIKLIDGQESKYSSWLGCLF